ncbi:MAG TPA: hypothetical protein VI197_01195 [Polyangiaceae bacterium]
MTNSRDPRQHSARVTRLTLLASQVAFACASYSPHHAARLAPAGANETSVAADVLLVDRGLGPELFAIPEFALSRGLSQDWDAGGRVYPFGVELNARRRLLGYGAALVSVMPLVAVSQVSATNADTSFVDVNAGALLLNGHRLTPTLELTLGLRSQLRLGLNAVAVREDFDAARWALLAGTSVALQWRLSPHTMLVPGVVVLCPYDLDRGVWDFPIVQGGAGVTW